MSLITKSLINQYISTTPSDEVVDTITKSIETNELSLIQLVQFLGSYLTSTNDKARSLSINLLSTVLSNLNTKKLYPKDIEVLLTFFFTKFDDKLCLKSSLLGINSLIKMNQFDESSIEKILNKLLSDYKSIDNLASVRYSTFKILETLASNNIDFLISNLNSLFIETFLNITKNEKDPKNLLESFKLNYLISTKFDITEHIEDLFDCMFCYFPINFKSSSNDPYEISSEKLKNSLRLCLSSNDLYAPEIFPNLIEKLVTTNPSIKLDILITINNSIKNFSSITIESYFISLWNSLKFEILHNELIQVNSLDSLIEYYSTSTSDDDLIIMETLNIFKSLSLKLDYSSNNYENYENFLNLIFDSLKKFLDIDNTKFLQSIVILSMICTYNKDSNDLLLPKILKELFDIKIEQIKHKRLILISLSYFINDNSIEILLNFKDNLLSILQSSLLSSSLEVTLRSLSIQLSTQIIILNDFLNVDEKSVLIQSLTSILINDPNTKISATVLESLKQISEFQESLILEITFPSLLNSLIESDEKNDQFKISEILNKFSLLTITSLLTESFSIRLLNLLSNFSNPELLLLTLSNILENLSINISTNEYARKFLPHLLSYSFKNFENDFIINYISRIFRRIVVGSDSLIQSKILNDLFLIFLPSISNVEKIELLNINNKNIAIDGNIISFLPILIYSIAGIDLATELSVDPINLLNVLKEILIKTKSSTIIRIEILSGISVIVNKYLNFKDIEHTMAELNPVNNIENIENMELYIWLLRGLLIKNSSESIELTISLISSLSTIKLIKCLTILLSELDLFKSYKKINGSNNGGFLMSKVSVSNLYIRNVFKQKLLESVLIKLGSNNLESSELLCLPILLKYIDENIYKNRLNEIIPIIMRIMSISDEADYQYQEEEEISVLTVLRLLLREGPELMKPYIVKVINKLIEIVKNGKVNEKSLALECLLEISSLGLLSEIINLKKPVIDTCESTLGYKKRSVRQLAVKVRQEWEELGMSTS